MKFIDFFSGIGGFRLGLEQAGHQCVGHCEIDKYADASYRMMHTLTDQQREYILSLDKKKRLAEIRKDEYLNGEFYADDITRIDARDLPEADIYCGGFPCQAFSIAGLRRGFDDTRGTLFFDIARLAAERQPRYLFLENVKGLCSHNKGETLKTILATLDDVGYDAEWQVLNSKMFVPQNRERIFIIAYSRRYFGEGSGLQVLPVFGANQENTIRQLGRCQSDRRENP